MAMQTFSLEALGDLVAPGGTVAEFERRIATASMGPSSRSRMCRYVAAIAPWMWPARPTVGQEPAGKQRPAPAAAR